MNYADDNHQPDEEVRSLNLPPHSIEAEQSLLGGLLLDNEAFDTVADIVNEEDFYRFEHRLIYRSIVHLLNLQRPADIVTVQEELQNQNELENAGGFDYLVTLAQNTPSAANIRRYAEIVRERSVLRQLANIGIEIARNTHNAQGKSAADLLDEAESKVFQIAENMQQTKQGFLPIQDLLAENIERIDRLCKRKDGEVTGISTGFIDLDKMTSGLQRKDLIIVAGRPSMGKTAFAINIAENVALHSKLPVAIFSMEMGGAQLVGRMLSSVGRLDQSLLSRGKLEDYHWVDFLEAARKLSEAPIHIDETGVLTALEVRARSRRLARRYGGKLGLIVIDYLQMMQGSGRRSESRVAELGEISRSLKALAKELDVPIIALSQLSRKVEDRTDRKPMMSDLRDSGAIEQDADLIMLIHRDEYYTREKSKFKGLAECIIGKHRNGPTGSVWLTFLGKYTRFENAAEKPNFDTSD